MNGFDKKRIEYNRMVTWLLSEIMDKHPTLRISQIIRDTHPLEEPWDTYERLIKTFNKEKEND